MPPGSLEQILAGLDLPRDPDLLVGLEGSDDAGVYRLTPELALIQTVDFFTPIVDDPFRFGQVAAANALSDVYAMGGVPKTALNLVAFPSKSMDLDILRRILEGGLERLREAEVLLVGGHSIEDGEIKYGISVTGVVHPDRVLTNRGLVPGAALVLTKPIGTGVLATAVKAELAPSEAVAAMEESMIALNREAGAVAASYPIQACTDITGFGLIGHLAEMVATARVTAVVEADRVPLLPGAREAAGMGLVPAGARANREYRAGMVELPDPVDPVMVDLLHDPQTSGGLLYALPAERADALVAALADKGVAAVRIGRVEPGEGRIRVEGAGR